MLTAIYATLLWMIALLGAVAPLVRLRVAQPLGIAAKQGIPVYVLELFREQIVGQRGKHLRVVLNPVRVDQVQILMLDRVQIQLKPLHQFLEVKLFLRLFVHLRADTVRGHLDDGLLREAKIERAH